MPSKKPEMPDEGVVGNPSPSPSSQIVPLFVLRRNISDPITGKIMPRGRAYSREEMGLDEVVLQAMIARKVIFELQDVPLVDIPRWRLLSNRLNAAGIYTARQLMEGDLDTIGSILHMDTNTVQTVQQELRDNWLTATHVEDSNG